MPDDDPSPIEIDFARKETEAGWIRVQDRFSRHAAPVWFNWVGWTLAIAALQYLWDRTHNILLIAPLAISVGLLWFHMNAVFYRLRFRNLPFVKRWDNSPILSIIISGLLAFAAWRGALWVADVVASNQTP